MTDQDLLRELELVMSSLNVIDIEICKRINLESIQSKKKTIVSCFEDLHTAMYRLEDVQELLKDNQI